MKFKLSSLVVGLVLSGTVLLTGCASALGTSSKEPSQTSQIVRITESNNAVVLRQLDLQMEREKTRRAEIEGENAVAGAIMRIAEKGGETSKVNGQTALLGVAKSRGSGNGSSTTQMIAQLPAQQVIQPERDWLDRTLQVASILIPGGVPAVISPVLNYRGQVKSLEAQTAQARINGETQQALYGTFGSMNATTVGAMQGLGTAGFQANAQIAQYGFGAASSISGSANAKPTYQITAGGDVVAGGGVITKTNHLECPLGSTASSGNGAPGGGSGSGAAGGQGGQNGNGGAAGGYSGTAGAGGYGGYSGTAGAGGYGGPVNQTNTVNCTITK